MNKPYLPELSKLLKTKLPLKIRECYEMDYSSNKLSANQAFKELLKYFWITTKLKIDKPNAKFQIYIQTEMKEIDDLWHTYLLFTEDYQKFCMKNFKKFIHHKPTTNNEKKKSKQNTDQFLKNTESALS